MDSAWANDATKCRCFPITLSGIATMWFTIHPPRLISRFVELATRLMEQFRIHATRLKNVMSLSSVIQAPGESLKDYLQRFHVAATVVSNPNDHAILMAVVRGVGLESEFGDWLARKPSTTLECFYSTTNLFMRKEEVRLSRRGNAAGPSREAVQSNNVVKQSSESSGKVQVDVQNKPEQQKRTRGVNSEWKKESRKWKPRIPTYKEYTPLNTSLENIYLSTCNTFQYRKPRLKESTEEQKQTGKYCRFHEIYGHNTDECRHLHDAIEKLIRQKKLQQLVKNPQKGEHGTFDLNRGQAPRRPEELARTGGRLVINTTVSSCI